MNRKNCLHVIIAMTIAGSLWTSSATATPIVSNGNFEASPYDDQSGSTGTITDWTIISGTPGYIVGDSQMYNNNTNWGSANTNGSTTTHDHVGALVIFDTGGTSNNWIKLNQNVSGFTVGRQYYLTFEQNANSGTGSALMYNVAASTFTIVPDTTISAVDTAGSYVNPYNTVTTATFTADNTTVGIGFYASLTSAARGNFGTVLIDNVAIHEVPEPSTLILLATGLCGLLAYAWRRRR